VKTPIHFIIMLMEQWNRKDLREEHPWVKVDKKTYQILLIGSFEFITNSKMEGHTMTLSLYNQIIEERYDRETIQRAENPRVVNF
jgi:hypothetical protein